MKKILFSVLVFCSLSAHSQRIKKERVVEFVSTLADDKMKGRNIGTPENDMAANYIAEQFRKANLEYCVGDSYLVPFDYQGKTAYNVCGIKKGKSEKSLAFTAHFDHIGYDGKLHGDQIFNGADDNASGTTAVIALADFFKKRRPEFTHIYMAFNGEEHGMLGSSALANDPKMDYLNKNIQAVLNFEMIAMLSAYGENAVYMTGNQYSNLFDLMNKYAKNRLKFVEDPYKQYNLFYRSDNVSYFKKDIVAHSFSTVDMSKATHYHKVNDDVKVVDFDNLTKLINSFGKTIKKLRVNDFQPKYNDNFKSNTQK